MVKGLADIIGDEVVFCSECGGSYYSEDAVLGLLFLQYAKKWEAI